MGIATLGGVNPKNLFYLLQTPIAQGGPSQAGMIGTGRTAGVAEVELLASMFSTLSVFSYQHTFNCHLVRGEC